MSLAQASPTPILGQFERHQANRKRLQPCVSLLVGLSGLSNRAWRDWSIRVGRSTLVVDQPHLADFFSSWLTLLATKFDLTTGSINWLAYHSNRTNEEVVFRLQKMSIFDLDRWLNHLALDSRTNPTVAIARWLLSQRIEEQTTPPESLSRILLEKVLPRSANGEIIYLNA